MQFNSGNHTNSLIRLYAKGDDARSAGVRERLQKARAFYADLREKMSRAT